MEPYKLPPLDLSQEQDVQSAARKIFKECSAHLLMNFERFRDFQDEASLMQIRIGMRRTRVALQVFSQIVPPDIQNQLRQDFRYFGNLLGEARDMDVFLRVFLSGKSPKKKLKESFVHMRERALIIRAREYLMIETEFKGGHFENVFQQFEDWRNSDWARYLGDSDQKVLTQPVQPFVLDVIDKGRAKLLVKGASIDERSTEELHKVRKYVKRCRYHLRFFASLIQPEKIETGYDILVQMQDSLGHVNDVKEGMRQFSNLIDVVKAEHVADMVKIVAHKLQDSGQSVADHLILFQSLWHQYEKYTITEVDFQG
jgi:CHAD domain-containing protein